MNGQRGLAAVLAREMRRLVADRFYLLFMLVLPLISFAVLWAIFQQQVPQLLPVVVCDEDHSSLSRQVKRMIDAAPSMRIIPGGHDFAEGRRLVMERKAYALILIPAGTQREIDRGMTAKIACFYNAQFILPGSMITRDLGQVVATLATGIDLRRRQASGEMAAAARAHAEPIRIDRHILFNPQLNYVYFLLTTLLPTMLQIFVILTAVQALGSELKEKTASAWLESAGLSTWRAVLGKLLPQTIHYILLGMGMVFLLFHCLDVPMRGSVGMIVAGTVLLVLACQAVGLFLVTWFANLRMATSAAAFYSGPAFAFTGVTFPTLAMPLLGRLWGEIIPLTHYLRLLVGQAIRGASLQVSMPECLVLLLFAVALPLVSLPRLGRLMRNSRYWGRL
jgi:ABC-2 type transport system permease protein